MEIKKRTLDKIVIGIFFLLIIGSLITGLSIRPSSLEVVKDDGLGWYRSDDLPKDCRLPDYENNIEIWKQNLRHEKETWYCLRYFE